MLEKFRSNKSEEEYFIKECYQKLRQEIQKEQTQRTDHIKIEQNKAYMKSIQNEGKEA